MENEKIKIYTEIGFGNSTFINTEKEYPDGHEERVSGFKKWILKVSILEYGLEEE